ncbi:Phosphoglucomutase, chloroplastic [Capsicum annuum]|nr:Phosphoglucomutase, chloroplastic [Capsicum annuum]
MAMESAFTLTRLSTPSLLCRNSSSHHHHHHHHRRHLKSFSFPPELASFKYSFRTITHAPFVVNASSSSPSSPSTTLAESQGLKINSIPTKPIEGQKTGTSGLRKKVKVFMQENYLANWIQALFNSLPLEDYKDGLLVLGGDGRYFNREAAQANGGFIMSASHNPGGPEYDWGIKFNYSSGQPAPESITDKIYGNTLSISEIKIADISDVDLSQLGVTKCGNFSVEVVDPVADYLELMEAYHGQPLTPPYESICASSLYMLELSQSHFRHFVHHGALSHRVRNVFISNCISSVMPTRPSQHPYFYYIYLMVIGVNSYVWPTLHSFNNNIPNVIPQVGSRKGSVYTGLTLTR